MRKGMSALMPKSVGQNKRRKDAMTGFIFLLTNGIYVTGYLFG